jgi:flagellin
MAFSLQTNLGVSGLQRGINSSLWQLGKSMEKLSSGLKINRASDDPAGLVISEQMRSRIGSLNQEISNLSNQINKYETASSSAMQLRGNLSELRSLAVAAANGAVNDPSIQEAYAAEADRLVTTHNNTIDNASFGTQKLLDGSAGSITTIAQLSGVDFSTPEAAEESIAALDSEIGRLDSTITGMGATQKNDLESNRRNLQVESENLTAAESQIRDTDYAREIGNFLKHQISLQTSMALLAQSNVSSSIIVSLFSTNK